MANSGTCRIIDDGTLDTVVACKICGSVQRYNFHNDSLEDENYEEWREGCATEFAIMHDCNVEAALQEFHEEREQVQIVVIEILPRAQPIMVGWLDRLAATYRRWRAHRHNRHTAALVESLKPVSDDWIAYQTVSDRKDSMSKPS